MIMLAFLPQLDTGSYDLVVCYYNWEFFTLKRNFPDEIITVDIWFRDEFDLDLWMWDISQQNLVPDARLQESAAVERRYHHRSLEDAA